MSRSTRTILAGVFILFLLSDNASAREQSVTKLPKDFSLKYESWTAGVLPAKRHFVEITRVAKDKRGGFVLVAGVKTDGKVGPQTKIELTEAQCLAFYKTVRSIGFFNLKAKYSEDVDGGMGSNMAITANGVTKRVSVYGRKMKEYDKAVAELYKLGGKSLIYLKGM